MADGWHITIHGDRELAAAVQRFELLMSDLRPFWPLVVPIATSWWKRQFDTQGAFAGRPWTPLTAQYSLIKQRLAPGRGLLVFTGAMRQAASRPQRTATARTLTLTIDDPKIEYHQEGTSKMPARPVVFGSPLPAVAALELDRAAERYVTDFLRRL
jgi:hypothetical protein